jgi:hypothetical protein
MGAKPSTSTEEDEVASEKGASASEVTVIEQDGNDSAPNTQECLSSTITDVGPNGTQDAVNEPKEETSESCTSTPLEDHDGTAKALRAKLTLSLLLGPLPDLSGATIDAVTCICDDAMAQSPTYKFPPKVRFALKDSLMVHGQKLFDEVAIGPPKWLTYALFLRSEVLFKEAVIHLIGCWPSWPWPTEKEAITDCRILRMLEKKSQNLRKLRHSIDRELLLATLEIEQRDKSISPATFTLHSEAALVVAMFSQWFRNSLYELKEPDTKDVNPTLIGALYRTIHNQANYMLPEDLMTEFGDNNVNFPCEPKELCENITVFKDILADMVKPVVKNNLMLHIDEHPKIMYLTCAQIDESDIPWKGGAKGRSSRKRTASVSPETSSKRLKNT